MLTSLPFLAVSPSKAASVSFLSVSVVQTIRAMNPLFTVALGLAVGSTYQPVRTQGPTQQPLASTHAAYDDPPRLPSVSKELMPNQHAVPGWVGSELVGPDFACPGDGHVHRPSSPRSSRSSSAFTSQSPRVRHMPFLDLSTAVPLPFRCLSTAFP